MTARNQVEKYNGSAYVCDAEAVDTPPSRECSRTDDTTLATTHTDDESLARINASDGDRLTIRAGTHIQEIYVDGEAPTFSEITPGDGARFKSAALRIGFEVRDDGSGLRHDGENVISGDRDAVLHDAANRHEHPNARPWRPTLGIGDDDGTLRADLQAGGGSQDIDVTFYTKAQFDLLADIRKSEGGC